ncbi:DUF4192 domain-containing protein [Streptomyces zingiberis]|uniref:DUF4192 domain-containing protein n=1 Tax=Streptomyces zingiberis TaxID=2053010 RepID=A0ABX1BWC1_9ACTN|nr:DUF4192 domain-containing protein [Streptomyces zingiberis]NJQ01956.1 DUF4192 domain-containing protein [Streptomyces zingiberis]
MTKYSEPRPPSPAGQVSLRSPAELADALPYLMGFHPDDSIVMVAVHGGRGRFGGRLRLGIPREPREWPAVAEQLARCLVAGSARRRGRPDGVIVFLCQDPPDGESGREVAERLRPLSRELRLACGALEVPVLEALCVAGGRFWSYCCPDPRCCPEEGTPLAPRGTSVMAAASAYAGLPVVGSLREMEARFAPIRPGAVAQEAALDAAAARLVPRILDGTGREAVQEETLALAERLLHRFARRPAAGGGPAADTGDDALLDPGEAAELLLGLQDRTTRDRAAEWMEGPEAEPALRLWRALARRCVGAYAEHAAAPLTLAGWVAWSTGDEPAARAALGLALRADPEYVFARLLHEGTNEGVDPEVLRGCLREERAARRAAGARPEGRPAGGSRRGGRPAGRAPGGTRPPVAGDRRRGARRTGLAEGKGRS